MNDIVYFLSVYDGDVCLGKMFQRKGKDILGMIWCIVGGAVVALIGFILMLKPGVVYGFFSDSAVGGSKESAELWIRWARSTGILFVVLGALMAILPLLPIRISFW